MDYESADDVPSVHLLAATEGERGEKTQIGVLSLLNQLKGIIDHTACNSSLFCSASGGGEGEVTAVFSTSVELDPDSLIVQQENSLFFSH